MNLPQARFRQTVVMIVGSALLAAIAGIARTAPAQTSYPMLMSLKPVAAQLGQSSVHTVNSRGSMLGAFQVVVTGDGVKGEVIPAEMPASDKDKKPNGEKLQVRFTVAADAEPGVRDFRIATPQGVSTLGQLVVARDPVIAESGPNETPEKATEVTLPATLCGAIEKNEDVDYFKFHVDAGTAHTFHVRAQRLQDRIHDLQQHVDPIITLKSAAGVTLAAADNEFFGDPMLSYVFDQAGDYLLEIRDVRFEGNNFWEYSIEVNSRPFVVNVHPLALTRGQENRVELVGPRLPPDPFVGFTPPAAWPLGPRWLTLPVNPGPANPVSVMIVDGPVVLEAAGANNDPGTAQAIAVPASVAGRIETDGDVDCFAFDAKKGEKLTFEVRARRHQSSLDSHLRILDAQGKQLALNDDLRLGNVLSSDSQVEDWAAPADGKYIAEVRDLHLRGGAGFVYVLQVTRSQPYFELLLDTDKTQLAPGTGGTIFVRALRKNGYQGEIQLQIDGLPPGVAASCGRILAGKGQDACIVLHAAPDAPLSVANTVVRGFGIHEVPDGASMVISAVARPQQEIYQPGGGRGHWPADLHTINVGAPSDIRGVKLSTYTVRLKPGASQKIDVSVLRAEGFDKNVTLDVTYNHLSSVFGNSLPNGVSMDAKNSKTLLTGKESDGHITLTADKDAAPVENQQAVLMANVSLNFVMKATYASFPIFVTIEKP